MEQGSWEQAGEVARGWIGPTAVVENFLAVIGADKDVDGKFLLVGNPGEGPMSFMGLGDELCIPGSVCYLVKGKPVKLAANMVATIGEGAGRGISCVVI